MGWSFEGLWPLVRWHVVDPVVRWLRKSPQQWFRRSDGPVRPILPGPGPQPRPRPMVAQKSSEGRHRPKQRAARFGGRSFRSRQQ